MRGLGACMLVAVGALCLAPASASAIPFGASLNRPPNNTLTCSQILFTTGPTTCSVVSVNLVTGESPIPPVGDGVVTQIAVRVGPTTGPMQVVVEQALRQDNPGDPGHPIYACCQAINASQVFTPAPNAVTTVNVNLPVKQSAVPEESGYYVDQHLALSVLSPNVPIPASADPNGFLSFWFPAWQVGDERAGPAGGSGATVLLAGEWVPRDRGVAAGQAVALAAQVAQIQRGKALVQLACTLTTACDGILRLQNQQAAGRIDPALVASKRATTYGKAKFSIAAGTTVTVKAKLKRAGKKLMSDRKKARVWANIALTSSEATVAPVKVKLKR